MAALDESDTSNLSYEFDKYVCTKETLKQTLENYGVAIIPSVLNSDECESIVSGIWDFLEHISQSWPTPINRLNKSTWREFYKLYPLHSMLLQYFNVGQAQVSWDVRQNIKIVEIFAYFWGCSPMDLLVSFDGLSFHLPPEETKRGWNKSTWYHTDQSYTPTFVDKSGFKCVQSFITGLDINENDATLSFLESSHKYHKDFAEFYKISNKANWYKLDSDEQKFYTDKGCPIKNIKCPKGSLVFWDSRTIHCGIEPNHKRSASDAKLRAVIYLCYMPRNLSTEANLRKKRKAFDELRTTNHYPCKIKLFAKHPRTYGGPITTITTINPPVLNDLGRSLAGF